MDRLTLSKSPLIEAVVVVEFYPRQPRDIKAIKEFATSTLENNFSVKEFRRRKVVIVKGDSKPKIDVESVGIILTSLNEKIGLFKNRFFYAVRGKALTWESYIQKALSLFDKYKSFACARALLAFSVRNRNFIKLPVGIGDFSDIVRHTPWEHKNLGDSICLRMNYKDSRYYVQRNVYATVEQNYTGGFGGKNKGILLDINASKLFSVKENVTAITEKMLDDVRETKDLLLISSLTESKLQTYKNGQDAKKDFV